VKISVYIPSYNQKRYLDEAIKSVLAQTLRPHQVIIVDDCSTDGSQNLIAGYAERYPELVTAIYHNRNRGIARTRIDALEAVTGDYVTYVDGDDRYLSTKLEKEARALGDNADAQIAFSNYYFINARGARTRLWADGEQPPAGSVFREVFLRQFPRGSLFRTELVRCDALKVAGFYDPEFCIYEDWELRIRLTKRFRTVYVDEPLSEYRRHGAGLSDAKLVEHIAAWEHIGRKSRALLEDLDRSERVEMETKFAALVEGLRDRAGRQARQGKTGSHRPSMLAQWLGNATRRVLQSAKGARSYRTRIGRLAPANRFPTARSSEDGR
jgi:glycosyltransferase involved in cell wall biosynthesis